MKIQVTYKNGKKLSDKRWTEWRINSRNNTLQLIDDKTDEWILLEINMNVIKEVKWIK